MSKPARRAIVTGSSGGIGRAVVAELSRQGMDVIGLDLAGSDIDCDVSDSRAAAEGVADAVQRLGGLDVVVHTVGVSGRRLGDGPVDECTDEAWDRVMTVNLKSAFLVCRATVPVIGRDGAIVLVGSILGMRGHPLFATHAYAASKAGLGGLMRAMAVSFADRGIRVNMVSPALVRTPMSTRAQGDAETVAAVAARQTLVGGFLDPEDVAGAVSFLASPRAAGITGVELPVDGGWSAS